MLFEENQEVLKRAREALERGETGEESFRRLADDYAELLKDSSRLLRFSDKMEKQLHTLKGELEKKVEEGIRRYKEQEEMMAYQSKMAAIGEMVAAISHQWKQPLNVLSLLAMNLEENFRDGSLNPAWMDRFAENHRKQLEFMNRTINDFRDFFKPDKSCSLEEVGHTVDRSLTLLKALLDKHLVEVILEGGAVRACIPHNELCHVVVNLVKNACEAHGERQGGKRWVRIAHEEKEGICRLTVEDNAGGIAPEMLPRLFTPYVTTKGEHGTGIGLHMCRFIVEESLQGEITVDNREDGVRFIVSFPRHLPGTDSQS